MFSCSFLSDGAKPVHDDNMTLSILLCVKRNAGSDSGGVSSDMDGTARINLSSLLNRTIRVGVNLVYDVDCIDGRMVRCGGASESSVKVVSLGVTAKAHLATS